MKREFLKGLELSDEVIDKIMAEHGKDTQKYKEDAGTIVTLQETVAELKKQLTDASKQIKAFEDMDIEGVRKAASDWKAKAEQAEKDAADKIERMQFDHALDGALTAEKARSTKAVRALLDLSKLSLKDGKIEGLAEQLSAVREQNGYLFEEAEQKPQFTAPVHRPDTSDLAAVRAVMGLPPKQ